MREKKFNLIFSKKCVEFNSEKKKGTLKDPKITSCEPIFYNEDLPGVAAKFFRDSN